MTETEFRARLDALQAPEPFAVEWSPGRTSGMHQHDFDAHGLVLEGSFTLATEQSARQLGVGDTFELAAGTLHSETAGTEGTRLIAAKLSPRA